MNNYKKVKIDQSKVSSFKIDARPESKSNLVLETEINNKKYYNERPGYKNSEFDLSIMIPAFNMEGELIFGNKLEWLVDEDGRYWNPEKLSSFYLTEYYIKHPQDYTRMCVKRMCDVQEIVQLMKGINDRLQNDESKILLEDFKIVKHCWDLLYCTGATFIFAADELVWQFRQVLLEFLPKKEANIYLSEFLQAPITKEALKQGYVSEKVGTRNILYSDVEPIIFYVEPEFFMKSSQDKDVFKKLESSGLPIETKQRFYALRNMTPLCIQFNEENQYIESKTMSAHTVYLLKKIAKLFVEKGFINNFEEVKNMSYNEIVEKLEQVVDRQKHSTDLKSVDKELILQGIGTSPGTAHGKVRLVKNVEDPVVFEKGDILVTKITDPTMVIMMSKASAIICDIGSITSHPSIVSREMGIPCVVNTKTGTEKLKDGTVVEVDGSTGEIFAIENKENVETKTNHGVSEFLDAFTDACCQMDFRTFDVSISWDRYDPLIANSWTKRILKMIDDCEIERLSFIEISRLFTNTSDLRNKMFFDVWMAKYSKVGVGDQIKIFNFYTNLLHAICVEDPYAKEKNVIHSAKKIEGMSKAVRPASSEIAKKLGRLVSACYHVAHALYCDMNPSNTYDNYLEYDVTNIHGDGHTKVIKEFSNLRPKELWKESCNLPGDKIEIVCVYKNVKSRIDSISHVTYEGDIINGLKFYSLKLDNKEYPIEKIDQLSRQIEELSINIFKKFQKLNLEQKKRLYYHQKAHGYKRIYDRLGQNWRPSAEILEEAVNKDLHQVGWSEDKEKQKTLFRHILDPRLDKIDI
jgi:phosphohistidine swiveling domain-containing protein